MNLPMIEVEKGTRGGRSGKAKIKRVRERWYNNVKGLWRNGNASDYESEDCRFDPCQARLFIVGNR